MCNMLSVNLLDDIVDKFTSCKPSLYNTIDDRIYHNSNSLRYTDTLLKLYIYIRKLYYKTNTYESWNSCVSFNNSDNGPYTSDYHLIELQVLDNDINPGRITTHEAHQS